MSSFAINGGKISEEGHGKPWMHLFRQGYARGLSLTQRGAGANMSVDVNLDGSGAGSAFVTTTAGVCYFGWLDATTNVSVTTSNPSNPRIDTVVAYVDLSLITSGTTNNVGAFKLLAVAGTAAASPTAPNSTAIQTAVGSGNPYITLGNIAVGAAVSNIVTANISDLRSPAALAMPYLVGGSNNSKGHLVPNVADSTLALLSSLTPGNMLFGAGVQTQANAGTAGGTVSYINLGGIKLLWLRTAALNVGATSSSTYTVTFPSSFFSGISLNLVSVDSNTVSDQIIAYIPTGASTTAVTIGMRNLFSSAATGQLNLFVLGS